MHNIRNSILSLLVICLLASCGSGSGSSESNTATTLTPDDNDTIIAPAESIENEHLSGGQASIKKTQSDAFSENSNNMVSVDRKQTFNLGDDFFNNPWVEGSASTSSRDGLGGLFNNNACQDCHIRDGRGHAPVDENDIDFDSILFRTATANISFEDEDLILQSLKGNVPDRYFGGQLQQHGISGVSPEVNLQVSYQNKVVTFTDGSSVTLREPAWTITSHNPEQRFEANTLFSARVAPPMIGLGLLALISEADILIKEDINDADADGISGKANYVWSVSNQNVALGRFGWKAGQPSILEQSAGAFVNDMGLTNRLHQKEACTEDQSECLTAPNGNGDSVNIYDFEVSDPILDAIAFYSSHLAVPERRNAYAEQVLIGKALFQQAGCQACHTESYTTLIDQDQPELSEQSIFPYTDMLLHDMGEDLADFTSENEPASADMLYEFLATATEWRTPPLWGLGLTKTVDPQATFLHDGRANTIMEAVLWHGGEAENAKKKVVAFNQAEREALLAFLNDL
ncbi:MAG: di-heme oxidoredictase family protein [Colwellia sp.]|nr:di-heme oxidoredictase family protein [Colwellia sp.]